MRSVLRRAGDHVLGLLAPTVSAKADTSWLERCYCRGMTEYKRECHVVGGVSGCTPCNLVAICV